MSPPSESSTFTLEPALDQRVEVSWHEAVALVLELAEWAHARFDSGSVPELAYVSLSEAGQAVVAAGSRATAKPVGRLGSHLKLLIAGGPMPAELNRLTEAATGGAGAPTMEEFIEGLRFFARPDRQRDLADLAGRLAAAAQTERIDADLADLVHRARGEHEGADEVAAGHGRKRRLSRPVVAAIAAAAFVIALGLLVALLGGPSGVARTVTDAGRLAGGLMDAGQPPDAPDGATPGVSSEAGDADPETRTQGGTGRAAAPVNRGPADGRRGRAEPSTGPSRSGSAVGTGARRGGAVVAPENDAAKDSNVFSSEDADVQPPRLVRPQLPSEPPPGTPEQDVGTLELLVDESGAVRHVRLISPRNRYQERMLVAAAKAWKFLPALRNGEPVKYRTRVRLTL